MTVIDKAKQAIKHLQLVGAVKRRGLNAVAGQGGTIQGAGKVIHKDGTVTAFEIKGGEAAKR